MKTASMGKEIGGLLLLAAVVGFTYNAFSPDSIPVVRTAPVKLAVSDSEIFGGAAVDTTRDRRPETAPAPPETSGQAVFRVITLDQMKRAVSAKVGLILDARTPAEFEAGHVPRAMNLYALAPETWVEKIAGLPRDTLMVVYCSNPHCPFARTLAEFLGGFGFTNLLLYDDGWDGWSDAGLPVERPGGGK
jgi:rhodanese-related sulfurtransferase